MDQFVYLGNNGTEIDIAQYTNSATFAFAIWRYLNINIKLRLFHTCVLSVLLYEISTWEVTVIVPRKLQALVNSYVRHVEECMLLGKTWSSGQRVV